jgi:hypothetical protein
MTRASLVMLAFVLAGCSGQNTLQFSSSDSAAVAESWNAYGAALVAGDMVEVERLTADDYWLSVDHSPALDRQMILAGIAPGTVVSQTWVVDEVMGSGTMAVSRGTGTEVYRDSTGLEVTEHISTLCAHAKSASGTWQFTRCAGHVVDPIVP